MAEPKAEFFFELAPDLYKKIALFEATDTVRIECMVYDDAGMIRSRDTESMDLALITGFETVTDGLIIHHSSGGPTYF